MTGANTAILYAGAHGTVILSDVEYSTSGAGIFAAGEGATVKVINSTISAPVYGIGTNAEGPYNYGVDIEIVGSTVQSVHSDGWTGIAVLVNVPCDLRIENSTITATRRKRTARRSLMTRRRSSPPQTKRSTPSSSAAARSR